MSYDFVVLLLGYVFVFDVVKINVGFGYNYYDGVFIVFF